MKKGHIFSAIAATCNSLMGIDAGYFGSSPRSTTLGAGVLRAKARLAAHRKAQAARLANAPAIATNSRQVERQEARRAAKMPVGMKQRDWHRMLGLPALGGGR